MKNCERFVSWMGIFLLLASLFLTDALLEKAGEIGGVHSWRKITVTSRRQVAGDGAVLDWDDLAALVRILELEEFSYTADVLTEVEVNGKKVKVRVNGVNHRYPNFHQITLSEGAFFTPETAGRGEPVVIIESNLAHKLCGTRKVLGFELPLFHSRFRIIGVISPETSVFGRLTADEVFNIYLPGNVLTRFREKLFITHLQIMTGAQRTDAPHSEPSRRIKRGEIENALASIGQDPASYLITDYSQQLVLLRQGRDKIYFMMGLTLFLIFGRFLTIKFRLLIKAIKKDGQTLYVPEVIRKNLAAILRLLMQTAMLVFLAMLVWQMVSFPLLIPESWGPEKLFAWSYYSQLLQERIWEKLVGAGQTTHPEELTLRAAVFLCDRLNLLGILGGGLFYTGLIYQRRWMRLMGLKLNPVRILSGSGGLLMMTLLLIMGTANLAGLSWKPDVKELAFVWLFIAVNVLYFGVDCNPNKGTVN